MRKMMPLLGAAVLALTSCTTPVSELSPVDREFSNLGSDNIQYRQPIAELSSEEKLEQQEAAMTFPPLMYLAVVGLHSTAGSEESMGFWQGELDQRGYHGLVAWAAAGFKYQQGGTLAPDTTSVEVDLPGPYLIKYACTGTGQVDLTVRDGATTLLEHSHTCTKPHNVAEFEIDRKLIQSMVIEQVPQPETRASYEYQVIQ
ncbi:hypothetical protein [Glutamicibacter protophormiae]|uniref:hypothetical protein n=1 Tax=Glutamicibacter protophormiae TaxID=37930 RepID=UPI0019560716|nr:hypothetical protein [Glutamicibacter protophormiae]QRQ78968.1 hypothetical protein JQN66_01505 [Glutamicibacter protophormiae]